MTLNQNRLLLIFWLPQVLRVQRKWVGFVNSKFKGIAYWNPTSSTRQSIRVSQPLQHFGWRVRKSSHSSAILRPYSHGPSALTLAIMLEIGLAAMFERQHQCDCLNITIAWIETNVFLPKRQLTLTFDHRRLNLAWFQIAHTTRNTPTTVGNVFFRWYGTRNDLMAFVFDPGFTIGGKCQPYFSPKISSILIFGCRGTLSDETASFRISRAPP